MEKLFPKPSDIDMKPKRRRKVLTLHEKMNILKKIEQGRRYSSIAREYDLNESSVRTIKKNENKIKTSVSMLADCTSVKTTCLSRRDIIMEQMEHLLNVWIDEQTNNSVPLTSHLIRDQARLIYNRLKSSKPHSENMETSFCASKGWFDKFRKRANLQNICMITECNPADGEGRENYKRVTCWAKIPQDELLSQQRSNLHTEIEKIINLSNMIGNEKIGETEQVGVVEVEEISEKKELKNESNKKELERVTDMDEETLEFHEENSKEIKDKEQEETKYKGILEILKAAKYLKEKILQEDHDLGRSVRIRKEIDNIMKCYRITDGVEQQKTDAMDSVMVSVPNSDVNSS